LVCRSGTSRGQRCFLGESVCWVVGRPPIAQWRRISQRVLFARPVSPVNCCRTSPGFWTNARLLQERGCAVRFVVPLFAPAPFWEITPEKSASFGRDLRVSRRQHSTGRLNSPSSYVSFNVR
jgi:hypothetical protein